MLRRGVEAATAVLNPVGVTIELMVANPLPPMVPRGLEKVSLSGKQMGFVELVRCESAFERMG